MLMRRRGMPLVRAAATTAVVAGTAGAVRHRQEQKYASQAAEQQAAMAAAQPVAPPPPAVEPATPGIDMAQRSGFDQLHASGALTDEEFTAAKAKALGL